MKKFLLSLLIVFGILLIPFVVRANPIYPYYTFSTDNNYADIAVGDMVADTYTGLDIFYHTGSDDEDYATKIYTVKNVNNNNIVFEELDGGNEILLNYSSPIYIGDVNYNDKEVKISLKSINGNKANLLLERTSDSASNPLLNQTASTNDIKQHWELFNGTKMTFSLKSSPDVSHILKVNDLTEEKIDMTISSDPVNVSMQVSETKEIDIDGDGISDIKLELLSIQDTGSYGLDASMVYTQLENTSPTSSPTATTTENSIKQLISTGPNIYIILFAATAIIICIIIYFINIKKKKGEK